MAIFSVNQNRQFFVAKAIVTNEPSTLGDLKLGGDSDNTYMYFQHMGHGGLTRTDKIDISKIASAKFTKASAMQRKLKQVLVQLSSEVNEGNPISGQDYILRIFLRQYLGNADTCQATKYGAVHAYKDMSASDFYIKLAQSLASNFAREVVPLFKFYVVGDTTVEVTAAMGPKTLDEVKKTLDDTYTGVLIKELEQPWRLGVKKSEPVYFDVIPTTVFYDSDEVVWGTAVEDGTDATVVKNGKKIADLEYFCMGERGDQYRSIGWPKNIVTEYLVDPTKEYNVLDIHYAFSDDGVHVQKSEKDLTIVAATDVDVTALVTALAAKGITVTNPNS